VFELPGAVGRVEPPPQLFLDPPNAVPDFVLGVSRPTYSTRVIYIAVWKDSDSQKTQPPSYFSTSNPGKYTFNTIVNFKPVHRFDKGSDERL